MGWRHRTHIHKGDPDLMSEDFEIDLTPMYGEKRVDNVVVKVDLQQMYVHITANGRRRHWGYVSTRPGHGWFLPLSGFPKEMVDAVQQKVNALLSPDGGGPSAKPMARTGNNAQEQEEGEDDE